MLTEERRTQLDGIVNQMTTSGESDSTIQFVVDDFKSKYTDEIKPTEQSQQSTLSTLAGRAGELATKIFPGKVIGEAIGTQIAKATVPSEDRELVSPGPTAGQVLGDIGSAGLNIAGLKGFGVVGKFLPRFLKSIGLGAGISGTQAIAEGGTAEDVKKATVTGGIVGGSLPVVGSGLTAIGRQIEALPARFVNSALSRSKQSILQDISKDKVDDLAKFVVEKKAGLKSANSHLIDANKSIDVLNTRINSALASAKTKAGTDIKIGVNNFLDDVATIPEAKGALLKRNDIRAIVERLAPQTKQLLKKPSLTIAEANKLRQLVDKTLGDRAFLGAQLSSDKIILKQFANNLRNTVKSKAPEGTREIFAEITNEIRFRDGLLDRIAQKQGNQVLSFGDFIGGGLGGVFGGGAGGMVAGVTTRRAIESVPFKLSAAKITNALTKAAPTIELLTPAQRIVIFNLVSEIVSPENQQNQ